MADEHIVTCDAHIDPQSKLCTMCQSFLTDQEAAFERGDNEKTGYHRVPWPHNASTIQICARACCRLCSVVWHNSGVQSLGVAANRLEAINVSWEILSGDGLPHYGIRFNFVAPASEAGRMYENETFVHIGMALIREEQALRHCEITGADTSSLATLNKIKAWLQICQSHDFCSEWSAMNGIERSLPSRLLEISLVEGHPRGRLVDSKALNVRSPYATLSYCWGESNRITLQRSNMDELSAEIPWQRLPQTFRDAFWLIARLSIPYLWIDALCIVQDDTLDWSAEAASMTAVYSNSALNIMADAGVNSESGLFKPRQVEAVQAFLWKSPTSLRKEEWLIYPDYWLPEIFGGPLNGRAWVVQERFLAPRALHFVSRGCIYWECAALTAGESTPVDFDLQPPDVQNPKRLSRDAMSLWNSTTPNFEKYRMWDRFVHTYALSKLTVEADRSIAISGLARVFGRNLGLNPADYLCGLWRPRFVQELSWQRLEADEQDRTNAVPSWSWLSIKGGMWRGYQADDCQRLMRGLIHTTSQLVDAEVVCQGSDPFGLVLGGYVTLQGPLCKGMLGLHPDTNRLGSRDHHITVGDRTFVGELTCYPDVTSKDELQKLYSQHVFLLFISFGFETNQEDDLLLDFRDSQSAVTGIASAWSPGSRPMNQHIRWPNAIAERIECLMLLPLKTSGAFRRVGVLNFEPDYRRLESGIEVVTVNMQERWKAACSTLVNACENANALSEEGQNADEHGLYTITVI